MTASKPSRRSKSPKTAHEKGTELEQAIGAIERSILSANPDLSEKSYTVDFRKIIIVDGVKHEIDVWIEFDIADGYKSIFIFEARNWEKTVGKDHIIVFSAKITAARAQSGFFVAKSTSKYAKAQAKADLRIKLLKATDEFIVSETIKNFHVAHQDQSKSDAKFEIVIMPRHDQASPSSLNMDTAILTFNNAPIDYRLLANGIVAQMIQEHSLTVPSHTLESGVYNFDVFKEVCIAPDILIADGYEIKSIKVTLRYQFEIIRARIISKFDVESRGRIHIFEGVPLGVFGTQHLTIIERVNAPPAFSVKIEPPV